MPVRGRGSSVKKGATKTSSKTQSRSTGRTVSRPSMTVQEAGRRGGETVKEKYGPEFYSQIGQKGGEKVQAEAKRYRELKASGKIKV